MTFTGASIGFSPGAPIRPALREKENPFAGRAKKQR